MYNDNDEMFEVSDFDEDIHRREALIEEAKSIPVSSDWNEVMHQVSDLRRTLETHSVLGFRLRGNAGPGI